MRERKRERERGEESENETERGTEREKFGEGREKEILKNHKKILAIAGERTVDLESERLSN